MLVIGPAASCLRPWRYEQFAATRSPASLKRGFCFRYWFAACLSRPLTRKSPTPSPDGSSQVRWRGATWRFTVSSPRVVLLLFSLYGVPPEERWRPR
jgi:hypothetical protein